MSASERRTQAARTEATRGALIAAARRLFAERGFAAVGTTEVVREAGVTRGALYHHFTDKADLLRAVLEAVEDELMRRIAARARAAGAADPIAALLAAVDEFLDAAGEPGFQQIALLDGPAVLGWQEWRDIGARYGLGLTEAALQAAIDAGQLAPAPVRPLAHLLIGAIDEGALLVARAEDPVRARAEVRDLAERLLRGLAP